MAKVYRHRAGRGIRDRVWSLVSLAPGLGFFCVTLAHALPWNDDMYWQPELEAGTAARPPVAGSVPTTGLEPPMSSRLTERLKAGLRVRNPVEPTPRSIQNGQALFRIYCAMCHGEQGRGDGQMVGKVMPSSDLHAERIRNQKDGYLYATIRSGGLVMPAYQHALSTAERWDLVNYVRHLQQQQASREQPQ